MKRSRPTAAGPAPRPGRALGLLAALSLLASCETTELREPRRPAPATIVQTVPQRAWEVRKGADVLGYVVAFGDRRGEATVYSVRNPWQQDLGMIDALGRAYRYLPHHREPAWVGSGTLAKGVAEILDVDGELQLVETDLPAAPPPAGEGTGRAATAADSKKGP